MISARNARGHKALSNRTTGDRLASSSTQALMLSTPVLGIHENTWDKWKEPFRTA